MVVDVDFAVENEADIVAVVHVVDVVVESRRKGDKGASAP